MSKLDKKHKMYNEYMVKYSSPFISELFYCDDKAMCILLNRRWITIHS